MQFYNRTVSSKKGDNVSRNQFIVSVRRVADLEMTLCETLNRKCHPANVKSFFVVVSWLGDGKIWYALMFLLPVLYGEGGLSTSWLMVQVGGVNLVLYKIIKQLIGRARPCEINANISLGTAPLDQYSFPSGHTMHAVAFSMIATASHPELAWLLYSFSSLVALSRVVLGLHYPTDVIAGAAIGATVAAALAAA
jgi:undecaprenyl-diphosphatase